MTGRIGPHTGIEFILFDRGEKHVIYFNWDSWPEEQFAAAELVGAKKLKFSESGSWKSSYIFYRSDHEAEATELRDIVVSGLTLHDDDFESKEYRVGEILGYTKEDVALYISNIKGGTSHC